MKTQLNGQTIPHDKPTDELLSMLRCADMQSFCLAREALSARGETAALTPFLQSGDRYRRLYAFKLIGAATPREFLDEQLRSDDFLFVSAALHIIAEHAPACDEALVKAAVSAHLAQLHDEAAALCVLSANDENYAFLLGLLEKAERSMTQEMIAEVLLGSYLPERAEEVIDTLAASPNPKLRTMAARRTSSLGLNTARFTSDPNSHVRRTAMKYDT